MGTGDWPHPCSARNTFPGAPWSDQSRDQIPRSPPCWATDDDNVGWLEWYWSGVTETTQTQRMRSSRGLWPGINTTLPSHWHCDNNHNLQDVNTCKILLFRNNQILCTLQSKSVSHTLCPSLDARLGGSMMAWHQLSELTSLAPIAMWAPTTDTDCLTGWSPSINIRGHHQLSIERIERSACQLDLFYAFMLYAVCWNEMYDY